MHAGKGVPGSPGLDEPQKLSDPSLTHLTSLSSTRVPLVAVMVTGPRSASVSAACPSPPVVTCSPPAETVAPADGTIVVTPVPMSVWDSVTVTFVAVPGDAVAGACSCSCSPQPGPPPLGRAHGAP